VGGHGHAEEGGEDLEDAGEELVAVRPSTLNGAGDELEVGRVELEELLEAVAAG
jgi:hypothetical protein